MLRNHPPPKLNIYPGESYMGIGFVDLLQLLISNFKNFSDTSTPAKYIGIDCNHCVIARNEILVQMMKDPDTTSRSILQVWYSTCLDKEAYKSFKRACSKINLSAIKEPDVANIIKEWGKSLVSCHQSSPGRGQLRRADLSQHATARAG